MNARLMLTVLMVICADSAAAQSVMDRKVGPGASGQPVDFRTFTPQLIGDLAVAAGVPIGFEGFPFVFDGSREPVRLSGLTLQAAVEAMLARDPRYQAFEVQGVLVFRPVRSPEPLTAMPPGRPASDVLGLPAPAVKLEHITGREAHRLACALLDAPRDAHSGFNDTKVFDLASPAGTVYSLLNAIVRAHGELAWILEHQTGLREKFPYTLSFMSGPHGAGIGVHGRQPREIVDPTRFARALPDGRLLDTIVGPSSSGRPLVLTSIGGSNLIELAAAANVPMGLELSGEPARNLAQAPEFTATGRTLREVLDILIARDPGFEWREMAGVIVIRSATAWRDSARQLFALVPDVEITDAPLSDAVRRVLAALGGSADYVTVGDSRRVSFQVLQGSGLDLLNALVRSHGALVWIYEPEDPEHVAATGLTHRLTFGWPGIGKGFPVR